MILVLYIDLEILRLYFFFLVLLVLFTSADVR